MDYKLNFVNKKKILILSNTSSTLYQIRIELIEKMIEHGYEVYFTSPDGEENSMTKAITTTGAIHILTPLNRRSKNPLNDLILLKKYVSVFKKIEPDVSISFSIKPNIFGGIAASLSNVPFIANITGLGSAFYSTTTTRVLVKKLYKIGFGKANVVFFQNLHNKKVFLKNNIIESSKARMIPGSGVNITKFNFTPKYENDSIRFLFVARIMKEKGIDEYLTAAKEIIKKHHNVFFEIIGFIEEEAYKDILKKIKNNQIIYHGFAEDVKPYIGQSDCIINPSYHEGMSNVLLEAAAMGRFLLASNIPGCKEIIDEGKNGFLFEPQNSESLVEAIENFLALSNEEREFFGKYSREKVVREFDRQIVIDAYMEEINRILEERK